jgi:hypothetical protein
MRHLHAIYTKYSPHVYLMGNHVHMRRIINSVRMTVIVMDAMDYRGFSKAKDLAAWVVMANPAAWAGSCNAQRTASRGLTLMALMVTSTRPRPYGRCSVRPVWSSTCSEIVWRPL